MRCRGEEVVDLLLLMHLGLWDSSQLSQTVYDSIEGATNGWTTWQTGSRAARSPRKRLHCRWRRMDRPEGGWA